MELAGKYATSFNNVIALAKNYMQKDSRQLAGGDIESEMVARIIPAAMALNVDPATVVDAYIKQGE
jgi:hypothetical protein